MDKLLKFLNGLHKESREVFASSCGTSVGYLRKAVSSGQLLNATTCVLIERASQGTVTRKDLHPEDWQNIWPELAADVRPDTDPTPESTRTGRTPASPHNILDTVPERAVIAPPGDKA